MTSEPLTTITFLGSGTSTGVPVISCDCEVCTSTDPRNNRTRSSIYLQGPHTQLLIDTGPDLRLQLLREGLTNADALLYTHGHVDHTAGFDETRAFCWRREDRLPVHASADTLQILGEMFPWAFDPTNTNQGYVRARGIEFTDSFQIGDFHITPFPVIHASVATHGFKITLPSGQSLAYASDIKRLPEEKYDLVASCDVHILDGLRLLEHPSHMTLSEACALADTLQSPLTYLTHLSHEVDYARESAQLPPQRLLAYDGLQLHL